MTKKIGKALARAIEHEEEEQVSGAGKSLLMNPYRSKIFQYVTRHPCSNLTKIVTDSRYGDTAVGRLFSG